MKTRFCHLIVALVGVNMHSLWAQRNVCVRVCVCLKASKS